MRRRHRNDEQGAGRNRLMRDTDAGMIFGVCAGLADYFGFDVKITRICVVVGGFFFFPTVPIIYLVLGLLLCEAPRAERAPMRDDPELRRRVRSEPHATLRSVRYRFKDLDRRLQRLEKHVTSRKYNLEREIDGLKD